MPSETLGAPLSVAYPLQRIDLTDGWTVSPYADGHDAVAAVVPGTTFNSYVVAGRERDPNFGNNIHRVARQPTYGLRKKEGTKV